jgi:hypothetical protein
MMTKLRSFHSLHEYVWFPVNRVNCNQILYIRQLPPRVYVKSLFFISLPRQIQDRYLAIKHKSPAVKDKTVELLNHVPNVWKVLVAAGNSPFGLCCVFYCSNVIV